MKKLLSKKGLALVLGVLVALGVCDLTLLENSHLKPVVETISNSVSDVIDTLTGAEAEAEAKPLIHGEAK